MDIKLDKIAKVLKNAGVDFVGNEELKIAFEPVVRDTKEELIVSLISKNEATALFREEIKTPFLMIIYFFPETFDVKPVKEATLWANRINAVALLPGFGVDEINHRVFYRYLMPLNSHNIDTVKEVVDIAIKVIDIYSESFIRIAEGSTYVELLDEALINYLSAIGASI